MENSYLDKIFAESSMFQNYISAGYSDTLIALKLADKRITDKILATESMATKKRLKELRLLINEEINKSYGGLFAATQNEAVTVAGLSYGLTVNNLGARLPKSTVEDLMNSDRIIQQYYSKKKKKQIIYKFENLLSVTQSDHKRELKTLIAAGIDEQLTAQQIVTQYGIKSATLSRGVLGGNLFTIISQSRREGRSVAYKKLEEDGDIVGYEYIAVFDSGTTRWCRDHDNKIYPTLAGIQKDLNHHFRCRSEHAPKTGNEIKTQRASQTGATDAESYKQWFNAQSKEFKKSTLLNRQYEAHLKGNYEVKNISDLNKKTNITTIKKNLENFIN